MDITCNSCGQVFAVDHELAQSVGTAKCLCGATLALTQPGGSDSGPRQLGKYMLQRRIAAGGMGEIYYAKIAGVEGFEREVAIKKLLPHLSADRDFIQMMVKEAKLTVLLNHPNIVQVFDLAKEGTEYYIAMEYVPAINLAKLMEGCVERGVAIPPEVAVHIAMQVLKGLSYAHDLRGPDGEPMHVLHRDITPQNILVTRAGWVKITDFGIAKARNEISTTSPGMIKGKLGYIAPEQLAGSQADHRLDIFCAGVVLWELLGGKRLFKGTDEIETFRLIVDTVVPSLTSLREDVTPALDRAVLGALTKNPDDRYPHAEAFYQALGQGVAPLTPDDCSRRAKEFFAQYQELFDAIDNPTDSVSGITDLATVALNDTSQQKVVEISDLLAKPGRQASTNRVGLWVGIGVLVAGVLGALAAWHMGLLWEQAQERSTAPPIAAKDTQQSDASSAEDEPEATVPAEVVEKPATLVASSPSQKARKSASAAGPLSQQEIQEAVQKIYPALHKCLQPLATVSGPSQVVLEVSVRAAGSVQEVAVKPALGDDSVESCVIRAVKVMRLRRAPKPFKFQLPLQVERLR